MHIVFAPHISITLNGDWTRTAAFMLLILKLLGWL
jgi:hypothetical protein